MNQKIIIFGAGKIGKAFIGQLFGLAGYELVFVDAVREICDLLNRHGEYKVEIRDHKIETLLRIIIMFPAFYTIMKIGKIKNEYE